MNNDSFIKQLASFIIGTSGRIIALAAMVLIIYVGVSFSFDFGRSVFYQKPMEEPPGTDIVVEINNDMSTDDIASMLKEQGLIKNELAFKVQQKLYKAKMWPGEYELNTSMSTKDIIGRLNLSELDYYDLQKSNSKPDEGNVIGGGSDGD